MRSSRRNHILILLITLSLAVWGIGLGLLPERVPVHWNFAGEVDRFGSKLEFLIFPVIEVVAGGIFVFAARQCGKKSGGTGSFTEKILFGTGVFEVVLFSCIGLYVMWKAGTYAPGDTITVSKVLFGIVNAPGIWVGVLLVVMGNTMPKARRNDIFGVRTSWSMSSDEVWRKSQRFGGAATVCLGLALVLSGCFLDWLAQILFTLIAASVWFAVCAAMSYHYYQKQDK